MPELLRFNTPRNPEVVRAADFDSLGIDSHPPAFRSARFAAWQGLAERRDHAGLIKELTAFLGSGDSVTGVADLGEGVSAVVSAVLAKGRSIPVGTLMDLLAAAKGFERDGALHDAITRTADTLLAAVVLGRAGEVGGGILQDALKALRLVEGVRSRAAHAMGLAPSVHLAKPVRLPAPFHLVDPCARKLASHADFFGLGVEAPRAGAAKLGEEKGAAERDCECRPDEACVEQNPCCAGVRTYVTDLLVVREEVRRYEAGELSYIENVLMGETRSRDHRRLERNEEYVEKSQELSNYSEKDHQATEKFALQKEATETIAKDVSVDAGVTTTLKYGPAAAGATLTAHLDASYDWSKTTVEKIAQDYAKDVVDRSLTRVEEKMRELVTRKRIAETEETNRHAFDNTSQGIGGAENISGQYFYVNKVSRGQVFSYGKRLLCDLYLPEPAELYKRTLQRRFKFSQTEPVKPAILPAEITPDNYLPLMLQYGITDFNPPPEKPKDLVVSFRGGKGHETRSWGVWAGSGPGNDDGPKTFAVPEGCVAESMSTSFTGVQANLHGLDYWIFAYLAGASLGYGTTVSQAIAAATLPDLEGSHAIDISYLNLRSYVLSVTIHLKLKAEVLLKWQLETYGKITETYTRRKSDYDAAHAAALAEFEAAKAQKHARNPFLNRETERIELKRMAISYISCSFFDEMDAMRHRVKPCGFPQMDLKEAEREGRWVQFFEQAFEWPLMTYLFYPYFWGRKCTWEDKLKESADDPIFEKFLQSGFARVQVPVRPGFEEQVAHFLAYGEIWQGNDAAPLPGDAYYVSLAQELREQRGNFGADRAGTLAFTRDPAPGAPNNTLQLTDPTAHYWDYAAGEPSQLAIDADLDREIVLDCVVYRIVAIAEANPPSPPVLVNGVSVSLHTAWVITLERACEGADFQGLPWATGAVYIGAPWEFTTPTQLVWLRGKAKCLPRLPITCEEPQ